MQRLCPAIAITLLLVFTRADPQARSESPVSIEVGNLNAEDGDIWLRGEIESFRRAHPNIRIRLSTLGFPSRNDIRIEDLPDLASNVLGVISDQGYEITYLVERDLIRPIESFLPDPDLRLEDFIGNSLDAVTYKGRVWGIPFLAASVLFLIDQELFRQAGISNPPATWDEVLEYSRRLTRDSDGDGRVDQWGFRLGMRGRHDSHMFFLWLTLALQKGAEILREGRVQLDHPALREAYDFLMALQSSGGARTDNRRLRETLADQTVRYAMQIAPTYQIGPAAGMIHFRIIPWPTWGRPVIPDERRHYLVIGKSTPEKEAASWEFVKWMVRAEAPHPPQAQFFGISCRKDLIERPEVRAKIDRWARGFDVVQETKGWNLRHGDPVMGRFDALEHLETIVTRMFHSEISFEEAMRIAETECNAILRDARGIAQPYALYLPDSMASSQTVQDPTLEALFSDSRDILKTLPNHPGAEALLDRTLKISSEPSHRAGLPALMAQFPDHPMGLFALEKTFIEAASEGKGRNLCEQVLRDHQGSSLSLLAWDLRLRLLPPDQRLEVIREGVEGEDDSLRRVALFRHAEDLREIGDFEGAAVAYLRFWGDHPECVSRMGRDRAILACLKNAGHTLDAEALLELSDPGWVARILHEAHVSGLPSESAILMPLREWCGAVLDGSDTEADWAALVSETSTSESTTRTLEPAMEAIYRAASIDLALRARTATLSEWALRGTYRLESPSDRELARKLALRAFHAGVRAARSEIRWRPLAYRVLECARHPLERQGDFSLILSLLEELVDKVPDDRESPVALQRLGELARDRGEFDRALGALARVAEQFPDSEVADEAVLTRGVWLYSAGRYAEAKEAFARLSTVEGRPPSAFLELAVLFCESANDSSRDLETELQSFILQRPDHPLARRARLLLSAMYVDRLAFPLAKEVLRKLNPPASGDPAWDRSAQALKALNVSLSEP
ncbi:MAG: extracellular solute-binding protein [Candidatus Omnitrophica bacterium]|nr:extracellular solute-binding protein [Candidatus Omnitrophota bacterium]